MELKETWKIKWQRMLRPMLVILIALNGIYSFLHWLVIIKWDFGFNESIALGLIPLILSMIAVWVWVRPGVRLLDLPFSRKGQMLIVYILVAATIVATPFIITQIYLSLATGKLQTLDNVSQVEKSEKTKYYEFANLYIDKKNFSDYTKTIYSWRRRYKDKEHVRLYRAVPMYSNAADTALSSCSHWMILIYQEEIPRFLTNNEEKLYLDRLISNSNKEYDKSNLHAFSYLERAGHDGHFEEYNLAIKNSELVKHSAPIIYLPKQGAYAERNGRRLQYLLATSAIGPLLWLLMIALPKISYEKLRRSKDLADKKAGAHRRKPKRSG